MVRIIRQLLCFLPLVLSLRVNNNVVLAQQTIIVRQGSSQQYYQHRKLKSTSRPGVEIVPNEYLITLNDNVKDVNTAIQDVMEQSQSCHNVAFYYENVMKGFAIKDCTNEDDLNNILDHEYVQHATRNEVVKGDQLIEQDVANRWWLDRLDQRGKNLDGKYRYMYDGTGVTIYVLDTGIRFTHVEFDNNRASCGYNAISDIEPSCEDNAGHGTFMAALAGGRTYGTAKNATIIAVRVLNRNVQGDVASVIAGLEYVATEKINNPTKSMVVSLSLGVSTVAILTDCFTGIFRGNFNIFSCLFDGQETFSDLVLAVDKLVDTGVVVSTSAGNSIIPKSACLQSPAASKKVITVGASQGYDWKWFFSNYGRCVDIFAPGENMISAYYYSDQAVQSASGTSNSAALVAGVIALYIQKFPSYTTKQIKDTILNDATGGIMWFRGLFSPDRLLSTVNLIDDAS